MVGNELFDGPSRILRDSLTGLSKRQQLIANNLANVDTPGYRPFDVPFERVLDRETRKEGRFAMLTTSSGHLEVSEVSLAQALSAERQPVAQTDEGGVDVDTEMSRLSETAIEYNTVAQLLAARLALLRSAVTEGRR